MDKLLAFVTALLAALERYLPTIAAYFAGKGVAHGQKQKEALQQTKADLAHVQAIDAVHASLDDAGLQSKASATMERIKLRLKARSANASGGQDD